VVNTFLSSLLPEEGPYLLATPASFVKDGETIKFFKHKAFDTVADLQREAFTAAATPLDAYFAMGSVHEVKEKDIRKKPNINRLRTFWLDIDVKQTGKHYRSKGEAGAAVREFCRYNNLPKPYVVDSGGGLHCYWAMSESIDKEQWEHYAGILKAATVKFGLLADPARTSDCASVLRVPGTVNCKTTPTVPVTQAVVGKVLTAKQMLACIASSQHDPAQIKGSITVTGMPVGMGERPAHIAATNVNEEAAGGIGIEMTEANPKRVVRKCKQLMWQATNANDVEEPQWYDMVGCLRHAEQGSSAVHAMSKQYPGYSAHETDTKINQHVEAGAGPTLCKTFEDHNPGGCDGCPYAGRISTPLQLGREMRAETAPVVEPKVVHGAEQSVGTLPDPPFPFKRVRNQKTGEVGIGYSIFGEDNYEEEVIIYEHDIYPEQIIFDEREGKYVAQVRRYLPKDGWDSLPVPLGKFYDRRSLASTLGDLGVMPDTGKVELLVQYMVGYIRELQKHARSAVIYAQLGWRDEDRFVLGDRVLYEDHVERINPHRNIVNALGWSEPRGELSEWRKVMAMYEAEGLESFQFGAGVAWAAPLFKFTNFNGMIVSMVGEKGCGKSSIMHLVNSVWGHKEHSWVDMEHDTMRAFYNKLGVLKNLPVCYDEVTNLPEEPLSDLCYAISKGQGRQRLNQDGSAKENFGNWQTMMLTTSNASLHGRLANVKSDASAEAVRVFEYYVPSGQLPKAVADETLDLLNYNYGIAGDLYIQEVMKDVGAVRDRIKHWTRYMEEHAKVTSGERFWAAGPACVLTGYEIANRLGLTNVNIERLVRFSVKAINNMRGVVSENTKNPNNAIADYLNSNLRNMLVLNSQPLDGKLAMVAQEPRDAVRIRYEVWNNQAYVDRSHLREWCSARSVDWSNLKQTLKRQGILTGEVRMVLGKGTSWKTAQTWCWTLNMGHPEMAGVQQASALNASEIVGTAMATAQQG